MYMVGDNMLNSINILSSFQMNRTDPAHMGNSPLISATEVVTGLTQNSRTEQEKKAGKASFADYLMEAANYVNEKQQTSSDMAEKLVLDPDSVDVHDVTIAMAEANLSLSIAQTVIERVTKAWTEITTTR